MYCIWFKIFIKSRTNFTLNYIVIGQVTEAKLLGITVDNKISCLCTIEQTVVKMGRGMAAIKRCRKFMPSYLTKRLVQALVF